MNKKILSVLIGLLLLPMGVFASSKYDVNIPKYYELSSCVEENIEPNYKGKYLNSLDVTYTINCDSDEVSITSGIFDYLARITNVLPGDKFKINFSIINNSNNEYKYKDNSFTLATEDLTKYNLEKTLGIGFNNLPIYKDFSPYRTGNTALVKLYNYNKTSDFKTNDLIDETLNKLLVENGYNGIEELNKYYLDYYNDKYKLNVSKLEDFNDDIIMELFNGNRLDIKESNKEVIELSYNWFYNKLFSYSFSDNTVTDKNSNEYSIGTHMRNNIGNKYFNEMYLKPNDKFNIENMSININGLYTVNTFMLYQFSAYMNFKLDKIKYGNLIVNYIDEDGNKLIDSITDTKLVGEEYSTTSKIINDYYLDHIDGNVDGLFTSDTIVVNYIYKKNSMKVVEVMPPDTGVLFLF